MNEIKKLIDLSVWTGNWPFIHLRYGNMNVLKEKLKSMNVTKAFIAPIEGILEQDPIRANKNLLSGINDDFFSPVLIIDLSYENWQECMEIALNDRRVKMVKLIPNYHIYKMDEKKLGKLVELAKPNHMVISIQMRIEDRRGQYPLMKVDDVGYQGVIKALSYFPDQVFILNNVLMSDIQMLIQSLDNVYLDISSLEHQDILEQLYHEYSLDRFLFSSHCPFFFPEGNIYKLKFSSLDIKEVEKVAYKNAEKIFTC